MPERIYLTGFMGSGKSTVAPILAGLLGFGCVDLDAAIERARGNTIAEIFSTGGEAEFRALESAALLETTGMRKIVVSLGGGTLGFGENASVVRKAGFLVYLRVDFETLCARVGRSDRRPLLHGNGGAPRGPGEIRRKMKSLFAEREPFYVRADLVVDAGERDPDAVAGLIAASLPANPGGTPR